MGLGAVDDPVDILSKNSRIRVCVCVCVCAPCIAHSFLCHVDAAGVGSSRSRSGSYGS